MKTIGKKIKAFVALNDGKLKIKTDAFKDERVVIQSLSIIPELRIPGDIQIIREGGAFFIVDVCGETVPIYTTQEYFAEQAAALHAMRTDGAS